MNKITFNKNYEKNKFNIKFLNKEKFLIFKLENFLNKESYNFINNSFPKIDNNRLSIFNLKENNYKYAITSKDDNYHELIKNDQNLKIIHDSFFSKQFFDYFYKNVNAYQRLFLILKTFSFQYPK